MRTSWIKRNRTTEIHHAWNDASPSGRLFGLYSNVCDNVVIIIITLTIIVSVAAVVVNSGRPLWPHSCRWHDQTPSVTKVWLTKQPASEPANSVVWNAKTVSGCWTFTCFLKMPFWLRTEEGGKARRRVDYVHFRTWFEKAQLGSFEAVTSIDHWLKKKVHSEGFFVLTTHLQLFSCFVSPIGNNTVPPIWILLV